MKIWVGVTDNSWFQFLAQRHLDEVNFWQPSGTAPFLSLPPGTPFLFKLKSPHNHIGGGGFFVRFARLPIRFAWEAFGEKNGAASLEELDRLIRPLTPSRAGTSFDIGCTILNDPFFLPRDRWIEIPENWATNIVRGKTYDTTESLGERLWAAVTERIRGFETLTPAVAERPAEYGVSFLAHARLGQGAFRVLVSEAYNRRCAITGESTFPVLEAAHIKSFSKGGPNNTYNGLLLRADFHKLFDAGLITVTPERKIQVSRRIHEEWFNGKVYYMLHGKEMANLPTNENDQPKAEFLRWHNENLYVG